MKKHQNIFLAVGLLILPMGLFAQQDTTIIKNKNAEKSMDGSAKMDNPDIFNNLYLFTEFGSADGNRHCILGGIYVQLEHHYFKIKYAVAYNVPNEIQQQSYNESRDSIADLSFIYGKSYRFLNFSQIQFGAGISLFVKTYPDEFYNLNKQPHESDKYRHKYSIGVVTEVRYVVQLKRYLAANVAVNFSENPIKSYNGWSAGFALGLF